MKDELLESYPGSNASAADIFALACEYKSAAEELLPRSRPRQPVSRAPVRLCAVHAIELFLNAYLLDSGQPPEKIRGYFHNLAERANIAAEYGMVLRKRTRDHLERLTADREYIVTRYGPELAGTLSEMNRLMATLNEVAKKCEVKLNGD